MNKKLELMTALQSKAKTAFNQIALELLDSDISAMVTTVHPIAEAIFFGNKTIACLDKSYAYIYDYMAVDADEEMIQNTINRVSESFHNKYSMEEITEMREALLEYQLSSLHADVRAAILHQSPHTAGVKVLKGIVFNEDSYILIKQLYWETCWELKYKTVDTNPLYYFTYPSIDDILARIPGWTGDTSLCFVFDSRDNHLLNNPFVWIYEHQ